MVDKLSAAWGASPFNGYWKVVWAKFLAAATGQLRAIESLIPGTNASQERDRFERPSRHDGGPSFYG